jgi:hypothetical protein
MKQAQTLSVLFSLPGSAPAIGCRRSLAIPTLG